MNNNESEKFGIEFVDPEELVDFIQESRDEQAEEIAQPQAPLPAPSARESAKPTHSYPEAGDMQAPEVDFDEESEDYEEGFEDALTYTDKILEEASDYVVKKQEDIRGRLAILYTIFTFLVFLVGIFICVLDGILRNVSIIDNLSQVLPLLSGLFLGTLGFVIGYYFRKDE